MTHTFNQYPYPLKPNALPPQSYSTSSQSMHPLPGRDYTQEQYGGGRCPQPPPPVELTPTRLRSKIKATQCNIGIVKKAAIRRQENSFPSDTLTSPSAPPEPAPAHPIMPQSIKGSSRQIAPMITNIIPPTPLKDAGSNYSLSGLPPHPSPHKCGASIDTGNDSKDVPASMSVQSFVTGWKSANTSAILEAAFIKIKQSFLELSGITQSKNLHGLGLRFLQTEALWTKCYDLFKEAFPDMYKDILSVYDYVKMLSASSQTVSQRGQEFKKYYQRMFSIADGAAAKFGFDTAMVICSSIVNQDMSLGQVHTTSGAAEFWSMRCQADDDTIIGYLKAYIYNKTSLVVIEDAFNNLPEDDDEEASSKDTDLIPPTEVEGHNESLWWFKKEIAKQVTDLGRKFASDKNFSWKTMPSALASGSLIIKGYPTHKCLMPGVLTYKEVAALVDAYKAGTMQVVKSAYIHMSLIESTKPVIIREAPPSTWEHSYYVGTSVAQTRVKKGKKASKACDPEHQDAVMSPRPPTYPSKVVAKPIAKPQTPPPACPFKDIAKPIARPLTPPLPRPFQVVAITKPAVPMAPEAAMQEVVKLTSASEGSKDATAEELDTKYEDNSCGKKWKLKLESSSQASKKCVSSEVVIEPKKEVDEEHSSGNEAAQSVQPAIYRTVLPKYSQNPRHPQNQNMQ
ncbi:hypothetical protein DFH29DRAFT_876010 [Suillus ampliporus]|nr:hypothetical protein DFH29DRAFT_876010 [Suillus ampliporus]